MLHKRPIAMRIEDLDYRHRAYLNIGWAILNLNDRRQRETKRPSQIAS